MLSQVELRSSAAPAPLPVKKGKTRGLSNQKTQVKRYVEGESEPSDAEGQDVEVEVDSGDEGSVEDIELGGESEEEESEDDDEETNEDEDDDDASVNGFIDEEAEEWSEEDEDGDYSE